MIFRPFSEEDFSTVLSWFEWEHFYYDTPFPDTIPEEELIGYLEYDDSCMTIMEDQGEAVGLFDFIPHWITKQIEFDIQFKEGYTDLEKKMKFLDALVDYLFEKYDINCLVKYVYDFDEAGKTLFSQSSFTQVGVYRQYIYKNGKYHDVRIFYLLRKDWTKTEKKKEGICFAGYTKTVSF